VTALIIQLQLTQE